MAAKRYSRVDKQPSLWLRQPGVGIGRIQRISRYGRWANVRARRIRRGVLSFSWRWIGSRVHRAHQQQHVGYRLHRGWIRLRLDRQQPAREFRAHPASLLSRDGAARHDPSVHRGPARHLPADRHHAGRPVRAVHCRSRARNLHCAGVPRRVLEPYCVRGRADGARDRDVRAGAERKCLSSDEPVELHGGPRRLGCSGAGEGRSRWRDLGLRFLHVGRPAQSHAEGHAGVLRDRTRKRIRDAQS